MHPRAFLSKTVGWAAAAWILAMPRLGLAAHFDTATGTVRLDDSAFSIGFENGDTSAIFLADQRGNPLPATLAAQQIVPGGIEGSQAFKLGGMIFLFEIRLDPLNLATKFGGRRVEIKLWQQASGTSSIPHLVWASRARDILGDLPMQLTGRGTDDGWREWTTGPVDYSLGGAITPAALVLYPQQRVGANASALIDAISFDDLGPATVPNVACTALNEAAVCGDGGACTFGRCAEASVMLGPVYQNAGMRSDYVTRRVFEFSHLEGGRTSETLVQQFAQGMNALAQQTSPARFWTGLLQQIESLDDAHASPPAAAVPAPTGTGICVHLGEADLLPGGGQAPLVFGTSTTSMLAAQVKAGDALTAIDGMPVEMWAQSASRYITFFGDPAARKLVSTPTIMQAAAAYGAKVSFSRPTCMPATPVAPCSQDQIQTITIDLGAAESGFWMGASIPAFLNDAIACDYRFHRAFPRPTGTAYEFAGSSDANGIRTLQINGVPAKQGPGGAQWFAAIDTAFTNAPRKLILDERTGFGGGIDAVDHLASYLVRSTDFDKMELIPQMTQTVDEMLITTLAQCQVRTAMSMDPTVGLSNCGNFLEWQLGSIGGVTPLGTAGTSSIAVLVGYDVSGNDFVTKLLTYRKPGATKIFGGAPTAGGFGVIWSLPSVSNELAGGSIQVQDTIFRASEQDRNLSFQTSSGVRPDVTILQKQSDAVRDIDTVVQAAQAWLNP